MVRRWLLAISLILLSLSLSIPPANVTSAAQPTGKQKGQEYASDRILVKFNPAATQAAIQSVHARMSGTVLQQITQIGVQVVKIPSGQVAEKLAAYKNEPAVLFAEQDGFYEAIGLPNDPGFNQQWGLNVTHASHAWNITTGSAAVKIAILDTGIDQNHEDLAAKIVMNNNFTNSPSVDDLFGHGTHVAGIAAAIANNGIGVAGMGYSSVLMNGKVLDDNGGGYASWIANGIVWATDNGAKVINLSLGSRYSSSAIENAVNYAWNKGVVIVAAAGNAGTSAPDYPAYYANVIAVGATDNTDVKAGFSTYGDWVDVAAPGVGIYSTLPNHANKIGGTNYGSLSGTSMASPFVAGLAALIWSSPYGTSNLLVRINIESRADHVSGTGVYWQYGRINAFSALKTDIPRINTTQANNLSSTSAILSGNLISLDKDTSVQVSFDYGESLNLGNSTPFQTETATGIFTRKVTGLLPSSRYYFRAKATGSGGTAYGEINTFVTPPYPVESRAGEGGIISPSGTIMIDYGASIPFNILANLGYHIANVVADGISIGAVSSYTFTNVTAPHSIAAYFATGELLAWGDNSAGQLGDGTTTERHYPVEVAGIADRVISLACAGSSSIVLKSDGTVWAWGDNTFGQLGDGTTTARRYPGQVSGLAGVVSIAGGGWHYLALKSDGTVWAWGYNNEGQLGDGTLAYRYTPVQVTGLTGVISITAGGNRSFALKSDGTVWAWGDNHVGFLGDGTTNAHRIPFQLNGISEVVKITAGEFQTIALKADSTVWAWGGNDGLTPGQVAGLTGVVNIGAGTYFSLALKANGTVWAWGANEYGQLGDGTFIGRSQPVQTVGLSGIIGITSGGSHSLATKADGTVWAWGWNRYGQLGDNTTINRSTPVQVYGLNRITAIAGGWGWSLALKVAVPTQYVLILTTVGNGTVIKNPNSSTYNPGDIVQLTAIPASGWTFSYWSGNLTGNSNPANITMSANITVTATFIQNNLTITTTSPLPSGQVGATYNQTLTATGGVQPYLWSIQSGTLPPGLTLNSTTGNIRGIPATAGGPSNIIFKVTESANATATKSLNITINSSSGTSFGLNSGNAVYAEVPGHLQAMRFQNTVGTGNLSSLELKFNQVSANGNVMLGIYSDSNGVPGTLLGSGQTAAGTSWVNVTGLNVPLVLNNTYWLAYNLQNSNTVEYQGGQAAGSHVWGNAALGALPSTFPAIQYFNSDQYVMRATFSPGVPINYSLSLSSTGNGTVAKSPDQPNYTAGAIVNILAVPNPGYRFVGWTGNTGTIANVTSQNTNMTMNGNYSIQATFTPTTYAILVSSNPANAGTLAGGGAYGYNTRVRLDAYNNPGYNFVNWMENGTILTSEPTYYIVVTANHTITANFVPAPPGTGQWLRTGDMNMARFSFTATLLSGNKVLVAGGGRGAVTLNQAEVYDITGGTWTPTGNMTVWRERYASVLLPNAKVLVCGGNIENFAGIPPSLISTEIYDPQTGLWSPSANMNAQRKDHTATLLPNGKILVAGGTSANGSIPPAAEFYDPLSGSWILTGNMVNPRTGHTATLLPNGKVLVTGGSNNGSYLNSSEIYDPSTGLWTNSGSMGTTRGRHTATLLANGKVMVTGGYNGLFLNSAEIYEPLNGIWSPAGNMSTARSSHTTSLLPDNRILVAGGYAANYTQSSEIYNPSNGIWYVTGNMNFSRATHAAVALPNGSILCIAGWGQTDIGGGLDTAEIYIPSNNTFSTTTTLSSSLNPSLVGQPVIFTATVTSPGGTPTGNVTFKDGAFILGNASLIGGVAVYNTSSLAAGNHNITAVYNGNNSFNASTSPTVVQTINVSGALALFENYHAIQDNTGMGLHAAQTFSPVITHTLTQVKFKIFNGGATGFATVSLRALGAGGLPIGPSLMTSVPVAVSSINSGWTTVTFNFGNGYQVAAGTTYAIQINSDTNGLNLQVDTTGTYPRGRYLSANDAQTWWNTHSNAWDIWFEEWGGGSGGSITTYIITASAGTGGSILPSGAITVNQGTSQAFTITPNSGYSIANVLVDGLSAGAVTSYTFNNVSSNHTIGASFVVVPTSLTITTASLPNGQVGLGYSQNLTATGGSLPYGWSIQSGALPPGLSLSTAGVISGTPTTVGSSNVTFKVTDSNANTATKALSITITSNGGAPILYENYHAVQDNTGMGLHAAQTFSPLTTHSLAQVKLKIFNSGATGYVTVSLRAVDAGGLPTGPNLATSAPIAISSIPSGWTTVTFNLGSGYNVQAGAIYAIQINADTNGLNLQVDTAGTYSRGRYLSANDAQTWWNTHSNAWDIWFEEWGSGGVITTYIITASAGAGGIISPPGTITVNHGANQAFTITPNSGYGIANVLVDNTSVGAISSYTFGNITANHTIAASFAAIPPAPLTITTASLPNGQVGLGYSQNLTATGGSLPYGWSIQSGALPPGLSLSTAGVISGTPTTVGSSNVTFKVTDSNASTATKTLSITITSTSGLPTLYESYTAVQDNTGMGLHAAQTFSPLTTHTLNQVKLKIFNAGATGYVTVSLRAVDAGGLPTGPNLATSAPIAISSIPSGWTTVTFNLGSGYNVQAGAIYAIQINADTNGLNLQVDTAGTYSRGRYLSANDAQTWWNTHGNAWDIWFEEWGTP